MSQSTFLQYKSLYQQELVSEYLLNCCEFTCYSCQ